MNKILIETLIDTFKLLPFLILTFILIELFEHKVNNKFKNTFHKCGKFGPLIGSIVGVFPQCGFSVAATNLYITRVISLGTLIAIYLSTSDEMLPILIANKASSSTIFTLISIKVMSGIVFGFLIDYLFRNKKRLLNYSICEEEHCECEHGIFLSSIKHTLKIIVFIFVVTLFLNILFEYSSYDFIKSFFMKDNFFGPFLGSLIGLIPNCGASVTLTQLFVNNVIDLGTCVAGLLTGSGVAILVLIKNNKNFKENLFIISMLYFIGVLVGIFIELMGIL